MTSPNTATAMTVDNMDELLSDLELEMTDEGSEEIVEEVVTVDEGDLAAVETLTEKEEAVASMTSEIEADATAVTAPEGDKPAKAAKAPKTAKAPKQPKIERDLSAIPDEFFQLDASSAGYDKAAVIALRPTQKKIAEKFDNLFASLAAGRAPSVYTMACFKVLHEKGEVTSSDLVAAMKAAASRSGGAYSDGTARSQVGQLMNLFGAVGVAHRANNKLTFNKDSKIAERLLALV
ncbi:hypothetical protein IVB12_15685 [Bradyrhizobium sp. 179]|uniref:hypothetical protein n=1 Tax=Bradyrhizobium sp. 179 TaxID=2782648 RepID=UPI001FF73642|nr:hypothetical protein [Bradyrhizobium sp. 179]MCK1543357.1 hypothetical protein [Bradyrhizobium sp. 179]